MVNRVKKPLFAIYLGDLAQTPLLTRDEEVELAKRIEQGDLEARQALIAANLRLVIAFAKKYRPSSHLSFPELVQEGNLGLFKAVKKFDWRRGCKFSFYAKNWILLAISTAIGQQERTVALPRHMIDKISKYKKAKSKLSMNLHRKPSLEEIATEMGRKMKYVLKIQKVISTKINYLFTHEDDDLEDRGSKNSSVPIYAKKEAQPHSIETEEKNHVKKVLNDALTKIDPLEAQILSLRYDLAQKGKTYTFKEIGEICNINGGAVRLMEMKAIRKLRRNEAIMSLA